MCAMSEGSVPPFRKIGLSFYPRALIRRVLGKFRPDESNVARTGDPEASKRAATAIREHVSHYATLFERFERLNERSEWLEQEGTPSDSAKNRAFRAKGEAHESLMDLRSSFAASGGDLDAFDIESKKLYPGLEATENSRPPAENSA